MARAGEEGGYIKLKRTSALKAYPFLFSPDTKQSFFALSTTMLRRTDYYEERTEAENKEKKCFLIFLSL